MSEVVELDDFKEDLKVINEKLDILTKQFEKEKDLKNRNRFTPEKVMADRDLQRIFMTNGKDVSLFLTEWQTMTKEDKQNEILAEINDIQPKNKELYKYDKYCKEITKRAKSIQDNLSNFDKDIQKEKDNSRSI